MHVIEAIVMASRLSQFLYDELQRRGVSLSDFALQSGIPKQTLSNIINNPSSKPELATFVRIADGLNMPLWKILEIAGYRIFAPGEEEDSIRLARTVDSFPWLKPILERLLALNPQDRAAVLAFLDSYAAHSTESKHQHIEQ